MTGTLEITYSATASTDDKHELVRDLPEPDPAEVNDQAWFWTNAWQESIDRSIRQIDAGEGTTFTSSEAFLDELDED
jgi:hypothetical protein